MARLNVMLHPRGLGVVAAGTVLLYVVAVGSGGCVYHRVVRDGWAEFKALADKQRTEPQSNDSRGNYSGGFPGVPGYPGVPGESQTRWAVLLCSLEGPGRQQEAQWLMKELEDKAGFVDLWTQQRGEEVRLLRGRFADQEDPAAQNALRQCRLLRLSGRSFDSAELVWVSGTQELSNDPLDLKRFVGMYSLQIGFYDEQYGPSFRQAAEQAAQALRDQGEQAFYYHGPQRSMVTIGLFTDADFVRQGAVWVYGPQIDALREKYPYNLANGLTLVQKVDGQAIGEQPSFLVRVQ